MRFLMSLLAIIISMPMVSCSSDDDDNKKEESVLVGVWRSDEHWVYPSYYTFRSDGTYNFRVERGWHEESGSYSLISIGDGTYLLNMSGNESVIISGLTNKRFILTSDGCNYTYERIS